MSVEIRTLFFGKGFYVVKKILHFHDFHLLEWMTHYWGSNGRKEGINLEATRHTVTKKHFLSKKYNPIQFRIMKFFAKKIRQIEVRSAMLS